MEETVLLALLTVCELPFPHLINNGVGSNELISNVFTHITFLQKSCYIEDGPALLKQRGLEPSGQEPTILNTGE